MAVWWKLVKVCGLNFPYFPGNFFQYSSQSAIAKGVKILNHYMLEEAMSYLCDGVPL